MEFSKKRAKTSQENTLQSYEKQEEVQVDFEARNPEDCDYHSIKKLLQQLFLKANIDLSSAANLVIAQNYVGSVIYQAFDEGEMDYDDNDDVANDIFGVTTVINISDKKDQPWVNQLLSYLSNRCGKKSSELMNILTEPSHQVGLIINERLINFPPTIAAPIFQSLRKEIQTAVQKGRKYSFTHFLMISKTVRMPIDKPKKNHGKNNSQADFLNPEEQLFLQAASLHFEFSVASEHDSALSGEWDGDKDCQLEPYRTVMVLPADTLDHIVDHIQELYGQ